MKSIAGGWACAAALLAAAAGCQNLQPRSVQIDAVSGRFQSAQLTYELDTGRLSQPVQTARITGQQVSYQQQPSSPLPNHSHARLSVQYPHPRGKVDFALAEVIIESEPPTGKPSSGAEKSSWRRFTGAVAEAMNDILPGMRYGEGVNEAWALDIPKAEVDQLVAELANSGYFAAGPETQPGVEVFARLDGKVIRKTWRQVPALDAFIERVRHEGQLVSYTRPAGNEGQPADIAGGRNDSVAAYQRQQQRTLQQQPQLPPAQPFPSNLDYIAGRAGQPASQYTGAGAGAMHQPPQYQAPYQQPPQYQDLRYQPPQAYGSTQVASAGQNFGGVPPEYRTAGINPPAAQGAGGLPQYSNANAAPYNNANAPAYGSPAMPYGNAAPQQYPTAGGNSAAPGYGQAPTNGGQPYSPSAAPGAYAPTGAPQGGAQQPGYPQTATPSYPQSNAGYYPRSY